MRRPATPSAVASDDTSLPAFPGPPVHASSFCDALARFFTELGVKQAFGVVGGAIAPFAEALQRSPIQVIHTRHEGGAAFAAAEAHLVSRRPTVVFATTGPGLLNALTGLMAARWDGAKVIIVTGTTPAAQRGRWATQETSAHTTPMDGLFSTGPLFHYATQIEDTAELQQVAARVVSGVARPGGFVCHLALPLNLQTRESPAGFELPSVGWHGGGVAPSVVRACVERLSQNDFALRLGFGAREAASAVRALAERAGCAVMCTPRGKGIFPETHPQFVGVTGVGGHASVDAYMSAHRPHYTLVLGSRLGEISSCWSKRLVPPGGFIHVDIDPDVPGAAYPHAKTFGVQADIGAFLEALVAAWPQGARPPTPKFVAVERPETLTPSSEGPARPQFVVQAVQRVCVEAARALVMAEAGNAFIWCVSLTRIPEATQYRVSSEFGSMGHFVTGVVGAALARGAPAVAVVGDGAMLMNNEISTAVQYRAHAVWVVLNDSQYGMVEQGMRAQGYTPVETALPATNFATFAQAQGAVGIRVEREADLEAALAEALRIRGPVVVDVVTDPSVVPQAVSRRIEALMQQGAKGPGGRS